MRCQISLLFIIFVFASFHMTEATRDKQQGTEDDANEGERQVKHHLYGHASAGKRQKARPLSIAEIAAAAAASSTAETTPRASRDENEMGAETAGTTPRVSLDESEMGAETAGTTPRASRDENEVGAETAGTTPRASRDGSDVETDGAPTPLQRRPLARIQMSFATREIETREVALLRPRTSLTQRAASKPPSCPPETLPYTEPDPRLDDFFNLKTGLHLPLLRAHLARYRESFKAHDSQQRVLLCYNWHPDPMERQRRQASVTQMRKLLRFAGIEALQDIKDNSCNGGYSGVVEFGENVTSSDFVIVLFSNDFYDKWREHSDTPVADRPILMRELELLSTRRYAPGTAGGNIFYLLLDERGSTRETRLLFKEVWPHEPIYREFHNPRLQFSAMFHLVHAMHERMLPEVASPVDIKFVTGAIEDGDDTIWNYYDGGNDYQVSYEERLRLIQGSRTLVNYVKERLAKAAALSVFSGLMRTQTVENLQERLRAFKNELSAIRSENDVRKRIDALFELARKYGRDYEFATVKKWIAEALEECVMKTPRVSGGGDQETDIYAIVGQRSLFKLQETLYREAEKTFESILKVKDTRRTDQEERHMHHELAFCLFARGRLRIHGKIPATHGEGNHALLVKSWEYVRHPSTAAYLLQFPQIDSLPFGDLIEIMRCAQNQDRNAPNYVEQNPEFFHKRAEQFLLHRDILTPSQPLQLLSPASSAASSAVCTVPPSAFLSSMDASAAAAAAPLAAHENPPAKCA
jgi:hypothetical protein